MAKKLTQKQTEFMSNLKDKPNTEFFKSEIRTVKSLERRGYVKTHDNVAYKLYEPREYIIGTVEFNQSMGYYDLDGLYDLIYRYKDKKIKVTIEEI